mmetsp:Transcript_10806/g.13394  ORF Transcript_10806/g.13394 Transcript_10806/m.13394 type:complete len:91 (+) Transcript_10806:299-571(+)
MIPPIQTTFFYLPKQRLLHVSLEDQDITLPLNVNIKLLRKIRLPIAFQHVDFYSLLVVAFAMAKMYPWPIDPHDTRCNSYKPAEKSGEYM